MNKPAGKSIIYVESAEGTTAEYVRSKLREFNRAQVGVEQEIGFYLKNETGDVMAGLLVTIETTSIFLDILWVDEEHRGRGLGTQLILAAEQEARKRGIPYVTTDTFDFQAVDFYLKHGFESIGIIKNYIEGHDKQYFRKKLL